jgi:hypothetical protein
MEIKGIELKVTGIKDINKIPGIRATEITILLGNRSQALRLLQF